MQKSHWNVTTRLSSSPLGALTLLKIIYILLVVFTVCRAQSQLQVYDISSTKQVERIVLQPNGVFGIMFFDDRALGIYCGIIFYGSMNIPNAGVWSQSDRFWQEQPWCNDVTSIAWSFDKSFLYIATSGVYGDGGLFELDLLNKKYKKIFPIKNLPFYNELKTESHKTRILSIDKEKGNLSIVVETITDSSAFNKTIELKLK